MSVTKQIVKLLSARYNFSSEEGLEYVTTQLKTLKSMTKEEKAALIIQQKEQAKEAAKAAKQQANADAKAAKEEAKADAKAAKEQAKADAKAAKEQAKADAKAEKKAEKKSKKQNNTETVANETNNDTAAAAPADKEVKPKKPRTEAQIAATSKMIEANKLKKIAAATK
jgi:hypothetical protein